MSLHPAMTDDNAMDTSEPPAAAAKVCTFIYYNL